jgi:carboxyl-terminal processing protease
MIPLLLALALLPASLLPEDVTTQLDDVLFRLSDAQGARRWELAQELRDVALADSIAAVPHLEAAADAAPPVLGLVIARTLLEADAPHEASAILLPLLDAEPELATEALAVLAHSAFRRVTEVADELSARLETPLSARMRVAVARTLYRTGSTGRLRNGAREVLIEGLKSDDPEVRADAALSLAMIQDVAPARSILRVLAADPGPRGQLARSYLETEDLVDYYEHRLERQGSRPPFGITDPRGGGSEQFPSGVGSLDVIEELIGLIQENHLLGEELRDAEGREKLITAAAKGMLTALDPHSVYFSSLEYERWILDLRRHYAGIGAYVDTIDQVFTITRPIYSGPAYAEGLMSGDQILKVDGWETFSQSSDEIIKRLKGEPGTEVTISVYRRGWPEARDVIIERAVIDIDSVNWEMLPGDIGYVEVLSFADTTSEEMVDALDDLTARGMRGLLLDLRNNSGGYLDEAVRMASMFLPAGELVVYTEGRGVPRQNFRTQLVRGMDGHFDGPLSVLVNVRSASASEIVAGCLQEHGRAEIVGEKTYGKGSVQQTLPLDARPGDILDTDLNGNRAYDPGERYTDVDGDGKYSYPVNLKITNARYYLPSGRSLHTERDLDWRIVKQGGIEPGVEIDFEGIPGWQNHEWALLLDALGERRPFEEYVHQHFDTHKEAFRKIALGDDKDLARYPGWEEFRASLETGLPDNTIRLILRGAVRDAVADDRGKAFPGGLIYGDWQEDSQLQMAIAVLARELSLDLAAFEAYDDFAGLDPFSEPESDSEQAR